MRSVRGRRRWWILAPAVALLAVTGGVGGAAGATRAAGTNTYTGATTVQAGELFEVTVSNLRQSAIRPTIAIVDEDGVVLKKQRPTVAPGASAHLQLVGSANGGVWRARISGISGGIADTRIGFLATDPQGPIYLPGGISVPAATLQFAVARVEPPNRLRVNVTNVGSAAADADVDLYDLAGNLLDSGHLSSIATNTTRGISFNYCCGSLVRAVVTGQSGTRLIGTQEVFDASGRTIGLMEEEGIYF